MRLFHLPLLALFFLTAGAAARPRLRPRLAPPLRTQTRMQTQTARLSLSKPSASRLGLTGDICDAYNASTCVPPRICLDDSLTPLDACSMQSEACVCRTPVDTDQNCTCDTLCSIAERCAPLPGQGRDAKRGRCKSWRLPGPSLNCPVAQRDPGRFSYERCFSQRDCAPGRSCLYFTDDHDLLPCDGHDECVCLNDDEDDHLCSCKYIGCRPGEECTALNAVTACTSVALEEPILSCDTATATPDAGVERRGKHSFETCLTDDECAGDRSCVLIEDESSCEKGDCHCEPNHGRDIVCSCLHTDCLQGDECSFLRSESYCLSVNIDRKPLQCRGEIVQAPKRPLGKGKFSNEICTTDEQCAGRRECLNHYYDPCEEGQKCYCLAYEERDRTCNCANPNCLNGDVCAFLPTYANCNSKALNPHPIICSKSDSTRPNSPPVILPPSAIDPPATEETSNPTTASTTQPAIPEQPPPIPNQRACVDATALSHLPRHQLLYPEHVFAKVLCDASGSCATPGHIVHFEGTPMMMKKYCRLVGCDGRIIQVNSARYKRGLRIASKSAGLEYTAFAARYETSVEEIVMATVLRLGL